MGSELQGTPDLAKTRLCKSYVTTGSCADKECTFAHGEEELRSTNLFFKKTICMWNEKGKCRNGDQCRFAHGSIELRSNGGVPPEQPQINSMKEVRNAKIASGNAQLSNGAAAMRRKEEKKQQVTEELRVQDLQQQHEGLQLYLQQLQAAVAGGLAPPVAGGGYPHNSPAFAEPMKVKSSLLDANSAVNQTRYDEALKGQLDQLQHVISVLSLRCGQIQTKMDTNWSPVMQQDGLGEIPSPHLRLFA